MNMPHTTTIRNAPTLKPIKEIIMLVIYLLIIIYFSLYKLIMSNITLF